MGSRRSIHFILDHSEYCFVSESACCCWSNYFIQFTHLLRSSSSFCSTCFNRIDLPIYSSKEELSEKLKTAIATSATGFDIEQSFDVFGIGIGSVVTTVLTVILDISFISTIYLLSLAACISHLTCTGFFCLMTSIFLSLRPFWMMIPAKRRRSERDPLQQ